MRIYITGINWFPYNNCNFVKIFIDNGQGKFTPSKRSPYGQFSEAFCNREIARRVVLAPKIIGYDTELLVPEDDDIFLKDCCRRVNIWRLLQDKQNIILIPIRVNAHGNGSEWTSWSISHPKDKKSQKRIFPICRCEQISRKVPTRF